MLKWTSIWGNMLLTTQIISRADFWLTERDTSLTNAINEIFWIILTHTFNILTKDCDLLDIQWLMCVFHAKRKGWRIYTVWQILPAQHMGYLNFYARARCSTACSEHQLPHTKHRLAFMDTFLFQQIVVLRGNLDQLCDFYLDFATFPAASTTNVAHTDDNNWQQYAFTAHMPTSYITKYTKFTKRSLMPCLLIVALVAASVLYVNHDS